MLLLALALPGPALAQAFPTVITVVVDFDAYLMALFGLLGYVFAKLECQPAPMLLGAILGPMMKEYLRRALLLSRGDPLVRVQRPISAVILVVARLALVVVLSPAIRQKREEAFQEA